MLDAVRSPELAAELTLQPVRRYGVDAAILFSDIVVPLEASAIGIEIVPGRGPVLGRALPSSAATSTPAPDRTCHGSGRDDRDDQNPRCRARANVP